MRIDAHQHFWQYNEVEFGWISDDMAVLRNDFLPNDLKPLLDNAGITGCVAVQAPQTETETAFLLNLSAQNPFIKGVVGWVDLTATNADERLAYFSQSRALKGIRHIVQAEPDDNFMLRKDFQAGIALLEKFNLTYDILIYPKHLDVAQTLVSRFPNQKFVLDHLAKPFIKDQVITPWDKGIERLANHDNVYCKLSGIVTEADWYNWKKTDITPFLDVVLEAFGSKRLMFGSDWPVCKVAASYTGVVDLIESYISKLSADEQADIMGNNAVNFYNL